MRANLANRLLILAIAAALAACPVQLWAFAVGNPSVGNGWDSSGSPGAVGNPSAGNNYDTTSAVSIRDSSSQKDTRPWARTIDGSGLDATGLLHGTDGVNTMGYTDVNTYANTVRGGTVAGYAWVEYDLGAVYNLGEMWIWNANEFNWPWFGMKEVTIQSSVTGSTAPGDWTTAYDGAIPESSGGGSSDASADLAVNFAAGAARYVVITTDNPPDHNYKPKTLNDVGLSEVRFNLPGAVSVSASSSHASRPAGNVINGSGIVDDDGLQHNLEVSNMWLSGDHAASAANVNPGTVTGAHWIRFDFDRLYKLTEMWIWNYAERYEAFSGMNNVIVEYAAVDNPGPGDWTTVYEGALGQSSSDYSWEDTTHESAILFNGALAKHVVITAASSGWNFYAAFLNRQEVGLSEVRFFAIDPPTTCEAAIASGYGLPGDADANCRVNLADLAILAAAWLDCLEPTDPDCPKPWQ